MGEAGTVCLNCHHSLFTVTNLEPQKGGRFIFALERLYIFTLRIMIFLPSHATRQPCKSSLTLYSICTSAPGSTSRKGTQTARTCCAPVSTRPSLCSTIRMNGRGHSSRSVMQRSWLDLFPTRGRGGRESISSRRRKRVFTITLEVALLPKGSK
jgi:hypothetical protein